MHRRSNSVKVSSSALWASYGSDRPLILLRLPLLAFGENLYFEPVSAILTLITRFFSHMQSPPVARTLATGLRPLLGETMFDVALLLQWGSAGEIDGSRPPLH